MIDGANGVGMKYYFPSAEDPYYSRIERQGFAANL